MGTRAVFIFQTTLLGESAMLIKNCSKGFSLVELMVVVAIIAILAAVAIPAYHNHILRTRQADAFNYLLDIRAAQEMFYSQYNFYASAISDSDFKPLLSFDVDDSTYYIYSIQGSGTFDFRARALGKPGTKFANNQIWVTSDSDPYETVKPVGFKFSLMFR